MRRSAVLLAVLATFVAVGCRAAEDRADVCGDMGHLAATVDSLAAPAPDASVGSIRAGLEKMDPTFGSLSRSGLADPAVLDRLLRAHVGYRDLVAHVGDDETFASLGPAAPPAATAFRAAFAAARRDLACPDVAKAAAG
jgi:hypothetical protein